MSLPASPPTVAGRAGQALLAAASAGLLTQGVLATPFQETDLANDDYSNDPGTPTDLPIGTDAVFGAVNFPSDFDDNFRLTGLVPLTLMDLSAHWTYQTGGGSFDFYLTSSGNVELVHFADSGGGGGSGSHSETFVVPADGVLKFQWSMEGGVESGVNHDLSITSIPEAETQAAAAVAGLATLLTLRRRAAQA